MKQPRILYRDISHDPAAEARASHAPELSASLAAEGFRRVALLEARAPGLLTQEQLSRVFTGPEAERLRAAIEEGDVIEVMTSPDSRAFGVVERSFGGPVICLRTLLEGGVAVETVMRPARRPRRVDPSARVNPLASRLAGAVLGEPPIWARDDCPAAGYHVELVDTREAGALWRRHQQRVDELQRAGHASLRPQDDVRLYLCLNRRAGQILAHRGRQLARFSGVIIVGFMLLLIGIVSLTLFGVSSLAKTPPLSALVAPILLLFAAAVAVAPLPLLGLARSVVLPRLPGPPLQSAQELLAAGQKEEDFVEKDRPAAGADD